MQYALFFGALTFVFFDWSVHPPDTEYFVVPLALPTTVDKEVVEPRRTVTTGFVANERGDTAFFLPSMPSTVNRYENCGFKFLMVHAVFLPGEQVSDLPDGYARILTFLIPAGATKVTVIDLLPGFSFVTIRERDVDRSMSARSSEMVPSAAMRYP